MSKLLGLGDIETRCGVAARQALELLAKDIESTQKQVSNVFRNNAPVLANTSSVTLRVGGGSDFGPYPRVNLIAGSLVTISAANDTVDSEIDVTFGLSSAVVTGSGTLNTIPKWTSATVLGDSHITDDGLDVTITAPSSATRDGGNLVVSGGAGGFSGDVNLTAGSGISGNATGGSVSLHSGAGFGSGSGGGYVMEAGSALGTGGGGNVNITAGGGGATSGSGGFISITGGSGQGGNSNGGSVQFIPGSPSGSGTPGIFQLGDPQSGKFAILATTSLLANRTFTFPDASGTLALTSSLPVGANPTGTGVDTTVVNGSAATFMRSDGAPKINLGMVPTWTGVHTFSALDVHNAGVSLGTSGVFKSAVVDGATSKGFDLDLTTAATTAVGGATLVLRSSSLGKEFMRVSADGEFGFGNSNSLGTSSGSVLSFVQTSSSGVPTWKQGIAAVINHESASKTPTNLQGITGKVTHGSSANAITGHAAGLVGVFQVVKAAAMAGIEVAAVLGHGSGENTTALTMNWTTDGTQVAVGGFDRVSTFRGGYWTNCPTGTTVPANRPAIGSGICIDIPGMGDLQWGVEVLATSSAKALGRIDVAGYVVTTAAAKLNFPNRSEAGGNLVTKMAHAYLVPYAASAGGPLYWTDSGGLYFDDGTNNRKGLYESIGTAAGAWNKLLNHECGIALLGSLAGVNMALAAGPTTIYTTPANRVTRITHVVVRDISATLAGGTSYTVTGFRAAFSLATLVTANTGYMIVGQLDGVESTEIAASTAVVLTNNVGSTGAATATIDVFGYVV